jgi:hypothetical protein
MATSDQLSAAAEAAHKEPTGLWAPVVRLWRRSRFANRRRFRRYDVNTGVEVLIAGRVHVCEIANISSGGALLLPPIDCPIGASARLSARLLPTPLTGRIVGHSDQGTGIQFDSTLSGSFATLWFNGINSVRRAEPNR